MALYHKLVVIGLVILTPTLALAQYNPLVGLPYVNGNQDIGSYVNALYLLAIAVAAFLAVIKIIFGGVNYMLSDVVTDKSQAKKDIKGALLGLLIVLAAVLVLNTINPSLTNLDVLRNAERMTFKSDGAISLGVGGNGASDLTSSDGTVIGSRTSISDNDPNRDQKIADLVTDCKDNQNGVPVTKVAYGGYTTVECRFDSGNSTPTIAGSVNFGSGTVSAGANYNPNSTSITINCQTEQNTSCMNYCSSHGGGFPNTSGNEFLCTISAPQYVAQVHCDIDSNSNGCNYNPYGDTSAPTGPTDLDTSGAAGLVVPAGVTTYPTRQACVAARPNTNTGCLSRRDANGNTVYVFTDSSGVPLYLLNN